MAIDSAFDHAFNFTPSVSVFVQCETEEEINTLFNQLVEGGFAMMALGNYGFSKKFGWVTDKFGISWQLNFKA